MKLKLSDLQKKTSSKQLISLLHLHPSIEITSDGETICYLSTHVPRACQPQPQPVLATSHVPTEPNHPPEPRIIPSSRPHYPVYNPSIHRPGDTVTIKGKIVTVPLLDLDGNPIPD